MKLVKMALEKLERNRKMEEFEGRLDFRVNKSGMSQVEEKMILKLLKAENVTIDYTFRTTVEFGKCDGGNSEIDYPLTLDQYMVTTIANKNGMDFEDIPKLLEKLKDIENNIESIDVDGYDISDIKSIDFESLDFERLKDRISSDAYEMEKESYMELCSYDDDDYDEDEEDLNDEDLDEDEELDEDDGEIEFDFSVNVHI